MGIFMIIVSPKSLLFSLLCLGAIMTQKAVSLAERPECSQEIAQKLINAGINVNEQFADGKTPLTVEIMDDPEVINFLLDAGAKPEVCIHGQTIDLKTFIEMVRNNLAVRLADYQTIIERLEHKENLAPCAGDCGSH